MDVKNDYYPGQINKGYVGSDFSINGDIFLKETTPIQSKDDNLKQEKKINRYKLFQTVALVVCWITMGFYASIWSTTLPDLRDRLDTTTEGISRAGGAKRIGSMVGGLCCGIFNDRLYGWAMLFIAMSLVVAGTSVIIMPWSSYVEALGFLKFLEGVAQGSIDAVGNSYVMNLWGKNADPAMHAIHFGYPIGSIFSPILTASFLSPDIEDEQPCNENTTSLTTCAPDVTTIETNTFDQSRIEIPYGIAGAVTIVMSTLFFGLAFKRPPAGFKLEIQPKSSMLEVVSPASCARGHTWYGIIMVTLMILWVITMNGALSPISSFGFTYATESDLAFSKREGASFDMSLNIAGMVGRGMGIVLTSFIAIQFLLFSEVLIITVSCIIIAFAGTDDKLVFWVFCALSYGILNPAWPGMYSFIDKYIVLYSFVVALSQVGGGLTGFFLDWCIGFMYDNVSMESIYYFSAGSAILMLVSHLVLQATASTLGPRHVDTEEDADVVIVETQTSTTKL